MEKDIGEKIIQTLIELIEDQTGVKYDCTQISTEESKEKTA